METIKINLKMLQMYNITSLERWEKTANQSENSSLTGYCKAKDKKNIHKPCTLRGKFVPHKSTGCWGTWVAQSVKHPTLDLSSGHDLTVCEFEHRVGLHAVA